jgi:hypothetical protein
MRTAVLVLLVSTNFGLFLVVHSQIDFPAFYNAGVIARTNSHQLFNLSTQQQFANFMPFYHLPHEAFLFAPLSLLPYQEALQIWRVLNLVFLIVGLRLLREKLLLGLAMFAVPFCLYEGQDSCLLFLLVAISLYLLERNEFTSGAILALAVFKPQIPVVIALALLINGRKRFASGFALGTAALCMVSGAILGLSGISGYINIIRVTDPHETPTKMISIRGLFALTGHDWKWLTIGISIFLVLSFLPIWKRLDPRTAFATAILVGALTAFHFHAYDLVLILVPISVLKLRAAYTWPFYLAPIFLTLTYFGYVSLLAIPLVAIVIRFFMLEFGTMRGLWVHATADVVFLITGFWHHWFWLLLVGMLVLDIFLCWEPALFYIQRWLTDGIN